jgi:hypothetical protein
MAKQKAVVAVRSAGDGGLQVVQAKVPASAVPPAQLPAAVSPTATSTADATPGIGVVLICFVAIVLAGVIEWLGFYHSNIPKAWLTVSTPVTGVGIFAVFFVAAQAIERLLEPVADMLQGDTASAVATTSKEANEAVTAAASAPDPDKATAATTANDKMHALANATALNSKATAERKVVFWAVACVVGIVGAAALHLFLFATIGFTSAPPALDVFATGLVVGAGTKPLHDLTTLLSAQASSAKSS